MARLVLSGARPAVRSGGGRPNVSGRGPRCRQV